MNEIYLKKIDIVIEECIKKRGSGFNLEMLVNYIISKLNSNSANEESIGTLENIIIVKKFN